MPHQQRHHHGFGVHVWSFLGVPATTRTAA
jgi:hypothetical protein